MLRRFGRRGLLDFAGGALASCRDWTGSTFAAERAHGLLAPWVLHTGLGPDSAVSGFMTQVIACAVQLGGMPVPVGGGVRLVDALTGIVTDAGGTVAHERARRSCRCVAGGRATGVVLADGETVHATRAVVAGVTPTQLYGSLLGRDRRPLGAPARQAPGTATAAPGCRSTSPSTSCPSGPAPTPTGSPARAIVHVTPGLDGVSRAVNEAERGLLPAEATIVVGQPCAVDPSRAPDGKWIVWIQLQELPAGRVKGDASGELDVGDGTWTEELREAYADRICARLGDGADEPRLRDARRRDRPLPRRHRGARTATSSAATSTPARARSTRTCSGARAATTPGHRTPVDGLWHIGASTHPGPGLGAGSGYLVAKELTRPSLPTARACRRIPGRS